eukprot:CAMPEP_0201485578 /NCGR_PEP_ID=MMETSP0151_2-20130828/9666_1 /ASSEMBLY_ACC=CAM_ASM_000257 /TAXON_ID=200890 /ORGANISM="Paramoeba atlantica, Strain 621/1 / CCAP 1560/9" /LENGTH=191 /DNA_ID=CAMNT_0047869775 /DNA_START=20 /DNA_END=592 /DNA_ORIENTATION=+
MEEKISMSVSASLFTSMFVRRSLTTAPLLSSPSCSPSLSSRQFSSYSPRQQEMKTYLKTVTIQDLIKERGRKVVLTVPVTASVADAVNFMIQTNVGAVIISDQKDPVGIFTEKDFLHKVAGQNLKPEDLSISSVMSSEIFTGSPSMSLFDAISLFGDHGIRHLPIADFVGSPDDADTRIVDIVSARDFFSW